MLAVGLGAACMIQGAPAGAAFSWPGEAARLEAQLKSEEPSVRLGAARRLARLTPSLARPLILQAFEDPELEVRLAAVQAALALDVGGIGNEVVPWLQQREARARIAAVEVLFHDPDESAIAPLGRVLADADPRVRRGAAVALGEMGRIAARPGQSNDVGGSAAAQLLGRLDDPDTAVRVAVIDSLARLGDRRAVLPLVSKIQDNEVEVRIAVVRALGVVGDPRASSAVLLAARDRDAEVRVQAARALGVLGDPGAIPSLVALSEEPSPVHVRRAALVALSPLSARESTHRDAALERLVRALGEPNLAAAAEQAATSLGASAAGALVACLEGTTGGSGAACARVLARVHPALAVEAIRRALEQGGLSTAPALEAAGQTGTGEALILALEHLTHPDPAARTAALDTVLRCLRASGGDERAAGPLLAALRGGDWSVQQRLQLVESLGWTGDRSVGPALASAAASTSDRAELTALVALGRVAEHGQDASLLAALDLADAELRRAAALSLRSTGSEASAHDLLTRLESREGQDREAVALALAGPLAASQSPAHIARTRRLIARMPPPGRDSLIEALAGTVATEAGRGALMAIAESGSPGDRAKVAEVLAFRHGGQALLVHLTNDSHAMVRAHAAWSLGAKVPDASARGAIRRLLGDPNAAVATNAFAAVARWVHGGDAPGASGTEVERDAPVESENTEVERWRDLLCGGLEDARPAIRVNAVTALAGAMDGCPAQTWTRLLRGDPVEEVRAAVVRALMDRIAARPGTTATAEALDALFELRRCGAFDRSRRVASTCDAALGLTEARQSGEAFAVARAEATPRLVYVAGGRSAEPVATRTFLALHGPGQHAQGSSTRSSSTQGLLRAGWTDRRGAFGASPEEGHVQLVEVSLLRSGTR